MNTARLRTTASVSLTGLGLITIVSGALAWWIGVIWIVLGAAQLYEARRTANRIKRRNDPPA